MLDFAARMQFLGDQDFMKVRSILAHEAVVQRSVLTWAFDRGFGDTE